jgi:glutathione synthase/RimK-type ligase-like ATP-grasp enzyme
LLRRGLAAADDDAMSILIVVNNPDRWELDIDGVELVSARDYLTDPRYSDARGVTVFNLCRSYAYQSLGYYVSLLAEARGHRPKPSIATIQDMKLQAVARILSDDVDELANHCFAPIRSKQFVLSIYFGRSLAKRYRKIALALFNQFNAPLLRARFTRHEEGWDLSSIGPIPANEIPDSHRPFVVEAATEYFANRRFSPRRLVQPRYELAILLDQTDPHPPSNKRAVRLFERLAERVGLGTERITKDDYGRIAEFDALFIRTTTAVNHYTYNFASRAAAAGLAVIDDPQSIVHQGNVDDVAKELGLPCVLKQPDSSFSHGVLRVNDRAELESKLRLLLEMSDLVLAQQYLPTEYDWRVGVFDKQPLFVCRYYMAPKHWQIYKHGAGAEPDVGKVETFAVEDAPSQVVRTGVRAANLIGDGLYGVDIKQSGRKLYAIEINDNPNIDRGFEDRALGKELYLRILRGFLERIERLKSPVGAKR